jgi:uncharacterized protein YbjT (DUF2867 family)
MRIAVAGATGQVGQRLELCLRRDGHQVIGLSRAQGWDLAAERAGDAALARRLDGVDAVVDVTNLISQDQQEATDFFTTVAGNLGRAAARAGVRRAVVLSIIGVDGIPRDAHYAAKHRQELVYQEQAPGPRVVRAAHFHEFAGMVLEWGRDGGLTRVPHFPIQPVHLDVVVQALCDAATDTLAGKQIDVAGPRVERLPDLVARLARARSEQLEVLQAAASPELAAGACLAGPDAVVAGPSFDEWLAVQAPRTAAPPVTR